MIENISSSSVTVAIIASQDSDNIDITTDVNNYAIDIKNIQSQNSITFSLPDGEYTVWYNYPDIWGVLTADGETQIFSLQNNNISISINKRGWELE